MVGYYYYLIGSLIGRPRGTRIDAPSGPPKGPHRGSPKFYRKGPPTGPRIP